MSITPQDRWQQKNGYISKSFKLKKEIVEAFKKACNDTGRTQAEVLTELMKKFIDTSPRK